MAGRKVEGTVKGLKELERVKCGASNSIYGESWWRSNYKDMMTKPGPE